ncbi:MAG: response regulator [Ruminococcus sp.]|nr:response regulator [Ruminococcus sp.]
MKNAINKKGLYAAVIGGVLVAVILVFGTFWSGQRARQDAENAVSSVSRLYLDELAGRREKVVASALDRNIRNMQTAVSLLTENDLSDIEHLQAYQQQMRKLYTLEKFAFVDTNGLIYTSRGTLNDIDKYSFDYNNISEPEISVKDSDDGGKSVIIAIPVDRLPLEGQTLTVCFMEIDMDTMLEGVSLSSDNNDTTFCNIYTSDGTALTDMVLGGLASEDNLLEAISHASFDKGSSAEKLRADFESGTAGIISFTYNDTKETLSYKPIKGTDWMLTYLIRESVISDNISSVSRGIIVRSLIQTVLTAVVLLAMFAFMFLQNKKNARLAIEKETSETANRIKQEELEQRLKLQNELLEQEKLRTRQDHMITALASDYRSVYYVDLDSDDCICYRSEVSPEEGPQVGDRFSYLDAFTRYANDIVAEGYREGFLKFIEPDNIRRRLEKELILAYRYLIIRNGEESYEMLRVAGVRHAKDRDDHKVHAIGVGFTNIDSEMRESLARSQALSDALAAAEQASKAKTAFLSNMSHEIRTPMNAIIGLNDIALNDPEISEKTRAHLEKIGGSANHLLSLINDILDMSRIESGRLVLKNEDFSFSKLLEQINTMFSAQCTSKGLDYSCRVIGTPPTRFIGDNMKLQQVLINILGNAVKFTPEGGRVGLTVERTAQFDNKSTLRFTVSDTGIGMSKEYLPKLFETFSQEDSSSTNKYGSSGLGMAITKNIVEMMNGNIEVQSEKGKGSTFTVIVTLMDSVCADGDDKDTDIRLNEMSVLVIDDDPVACEHAKLVLEKTGISCETVLSGREALELVRVRQARHNSYDLILVDLKMPDMDGVETTREIRKIVGHDSAIVIITAYRWDDVLEEAANAGVDGFIAKPLFASSVIDEYKTAYRKKNLSEKKAKHKADLNGRHILLAEDVEINAEIIKMVLSMRGMIVDHAENGRIALEKYKESAAGYYDAVLMDIRMPEMDGLEATMHIRALDREDAKTVPIIALTANAFDEDVQRSLQAGMTAHLTKPIDNSELYETLESLIK